MSESAVAAARAAPELGARGATGRDSVASAPAHSLPEAGKNGSLARGGWGAAAQGGATKSSAQPRHASSRPPPSLCLRLPPTQAAHPSIMGGYAFARPPPAAFSSVAPRLSMTGLEITLDGFRPSPQAGSAQASFKIL